MISERCPRCNGKGKIITRVRAQDNWGNVIWVKEETTCPQCGGARRVDVACRVCGASGRVACNRCRGSGTTAMRCGACAGRGHILVPVTVPCTTCHGTGFLTQVCEACRGRGYRTCSKCGGKGYMGDPCPDPEPPESETEEKSDDSDESSTLDNGALQRQMLTGRSAPDVTDDEISQQPRLARRAAAVPRNRATPPGRPSARPCTEPPTP